MIDIDAYGARETLLKSMDVLAQLQQRLDGGCQGSVDLKFRQVYK
jgi:hypothetical protein